MEVEELRHKELLAFLSACLGILMMISGLILSVQTISYTTYERRGETLFTIIHFERPYLGVGTFLVIMGIVFVLISSIAYVYYHAKRNEMLGKSATRYFGD